MRCQIFTDPLYHAERHLDFDPADVVAIEEKTARLFLRGKHRVTAITLKSGVQHLLRGEVAAQIEAAREAARREAAAS